MSEPQSRLPADSAEATVDLQDRIARFARVIFVIAGVMLVNSVIFAVVLDRTKLLDNLLGENRLAHSFATLVLLLTWRRCRGKPMSARSLEAVDATLTIVLCVCWAMLGAGVLATEPVEFPILLAMTHTLIARSVVVPSSFGRTLWISAVSAVPVIAVFAQRGMAFMPGASPARVRVFLLFVGLWCVVAVISSAMNSRQLFGLRERIREENSRCKGGGSFKRGARQSTDRVLCDPGRMPRTREPKLLADSRRPRNCSGCA
jgi:hypothetical protein